MNQLARRLAVLLLCYAGTVSAAVTFQAAGAAVSGTGSVTVGWPVHAVNDIALLFIESTGGEPALLGTAAGFAAVTNSPQFTGTGTSGTRLTVYWARATSTAMASPVVSDPGNHVYAQIITYRGAITTGNPWNVTGGGINPNLILNGITTTIANTRIVQVSSRDNDSSAANFSAETNSNLTGVAERFDGGTNSGNGGGFAVWDGIKAAAGDIGVTTTSSAINTRSAYMTLAIRPQGATAPSFQALGTSFGSNGSVTPTWPAHATNDIALLFVESAGGEPVSLSTAAGFVQVGSSPQFTGTGTAGTRITVFWARATSAAMPAPTVADPGDHVYAKIITYRGAVNTGNPFDATGGAAVSALSNIVGSVTTTVASTLIVQAASRDNDSSAANFSAQTNSNLTSITERSDAGTTSGDGGGFAVWDGGMAASGATGITTVTSASNIRGAYLAIALAPTLPTLHHIRIEHDGVASNCAPEPITIRACANAGCTAPHYIDTDVTGITLAASGTVTWSPSNPQAITAASGGVNSGITLSRTSAGSATLSGPAATGTTPNATTGYECYNSATGTSGDCSIVFSDSLSFEVPNHAAGTRQAVNVTACATAFSGTTRTVKFWATYLNPVSSTPSGKMAAGTGSADCSTGYSNLGTSSGSPTSLNLSFTTPASPPGAKPQATFSLCYLDVGQVQLDARYDGAAGNTPPDAGVVKLGNDAFFVKPDHFTVSAIKCTSANAANCGAGALAMPTPGDNPAASNATGGSFMRAGDSAAASARFTATVTAMNALNSATPSFGRESTPEGVVLTPALVAPTGAGTSAGVLTCKGSTTSCVVPGGAANFTSGAATVTDFAWNEVGIIALLPKILDADYLGTGEVTTPTASGNIGRFFPHHFTVTTDPASPIVTRADLGLMATTATGTAAPSSVIDVANAALFKVGSKVRIPGAGAGGNALIANVTAVDPVGATITLDTPISSDLTGVESVVNEWGSYMGEPFNAEFALTATDFGGDTTQNYQGAYAKLDLASGANPLGFGAVNAGTNLTSRLNTSTAASGSFSAGVINIDAPLSFSRNPTPDGPYAALQIGIDPVDSDGVKVGSYDLNVGGANDHASIMDPIVQSVTGVRWGRTKISNAHGSELLELPLAAAVQYWNGTQYVTNTPDNETVLSFSLSNYLSNLNSGETTLTPPVMVSGAGEIRLSAPGAGNNGSVDLTASAPSYLPGNTGRATFGIYKNANELIYMRENY